jgi:hypothetical protein
MSALPPGAARFPSRGRLAYAVIHGDPPDVYIAENEYVLTWVLAVHVVAATDPSELTEPSRENIRRALLEERWPDAVGEWIEATDRVIDAYPDEPVWTEKHIDEERATLEVRVSRIFSDPDDS